MKFSLADRLVNNTYQILVLKVVLVVGGIFTGIFSLINLFFLHNYFLALVEIIYSIYATILYVSLKKIIPSKYFQAVLLLQSVVACLILAYISLSNKSGIHFWIWSLPFITYLLVGRKLGTILNLVTFSICGIVFAQRFLASNAEIDYSFTINVIAITIGLWLVAYYSAYSTEKTRLDLAKLASTDPLTGLLNRNEMESVVKTYGKQPFSLTVLDIDKFKYINDTYGHHTGDEVLVTISHKLKEFFNRHYDKGVIIRLGGEEFCIILPNADKKQTVDLIDKLLDMIRQMDIATKIATKEETLHITASAGIACYPTDANNFTDVMKLADNKMYEAKNTGRDKFLVC